MSEFWDLQLLVDTAACVHEVKKQLQGFGIETPAWQISFMRFNSDRKQNYKIWDSSRQISSFLRSKSDGQTDINLISRSNCRFCCSSCNVGIEFFACLHAFHFVANVFSFFFCLQMGFFSLTPHFPSLDSRSLQIFCDMIIFQIESDNSSSQILD